MYGIHPDCSKLLPLLPRGKPLSDIHNYGQVLQIGWHKFGDKLHSHTRIIIGQLASPLYGIHPDCSKLLPLLPRGIVGTTENLTTQLASVPVQSFVELSQSSPMYFLLSKGLPADGMAVRQLYPNCT